MALIRNTPNQYNEEAVLYSTGASGASAVKLTFHANQIHVYNDQGRPVYVVFNSTTATTGGHRTCVGESLVVRDIPVSAVSIASSGGSTVGTTGANVRLLALGA